MLLVISSSLNPESRSRVLAHRAVEILKTTGSAIEFLDLNDWELPFCDGAAAYAHPNVAAIAEKITNARGILIAAPIYNFDVNAAIKNVVELTGKNAWGDTVVGFLLAAGGQGSYMSVMPFANSLMLDFRCLILPRFVYATDESFDNGQPTDLIDGRISQLCTDVVRVSKALGSGAET